MYLMWMYFPEYIKNFYNSVTKRQLNLKMSKDLESALIQRRYTDDPKHVKGAQHH